MNKGKYFLITLNKAIHADEVFLDGEEFELVSPCCEGNEVCHAEGSFTCEVVRMKKVGKVTVAHFFTEISEEMLAADPKVNEKAKKAEEKAKKDAEKAEKKAAADKLKAEKKAAAVKKKVTKKKTTKKKVTKKV